MSQFPKRNARAKKDARRASPRNIVKTVVITGVTRGLGRAMAEEFIRLGHVVVGCGRSEAGVARWRAEFQPPHEFDVVDVAVDEEVATWAGKVLASRGAPDLLLNNAALITRNAPLWEIGAEEFSGVVDVNLKGVANVIRHFVPAMVRCQRGVIVNFSSGWGRSADAGVAPYCATKWAIEGLTRALALELPPGMAAVPLNPGIIDTDMLRSCFGGSAANYPGPREWAQNAVRFLLNLGPADNGRPLTAPVRGAND
ncbi:MAG: SDR family oxidoreductase [Verrucomicrobiota bacterium]|nr:SDR family oxidoreductase [Verrucomicrobiota bacterium]